MAVDPSVLINLAAEYTGKAAFDKAGKATNTLEKNVKKLAKTFGLAFGSAAVVNFSKQAVKAFAQDEAAAIRLNRAVENLGIGFANPSISKYISELERSAAIADDILRPAFQGLLTTTGSLTKSQELLNNAITISRASGIDLATVSQDLANGYVGITKGLKKYNTGLTTAELSTKSFAEVLGVLLARSAGSAQDYLGSTQYKMDTLTIATGNASEIIGGGLVNAFARIAGGTEASDAAKAIEDIATAIAFTTETIGGLIGVIPNLLSTLKNIPKNLVEGFAGAQVGKNLTPKPTVTKTPAQLTREQQAKLLAKLEADALKRQKALLALQKKQSDAAIKAAADKAKLAKSESIFNLEKIQIEAALKGNISEEEKTRLLLMRAILEEDVVTAETLEKKLADIQKKNAQIAADLAIIAATKDPFATWSGSLSLALIELAKYGKSMADISATTFIPGINYNPTQNADRNYDAKVAAVIAATAASAPTNNEPIPVVVTPSPTPSTNNPFGGLGGSAGGFGFSLPDYVRKQITPTPTPITVVVNNNGTTIMQDEFVKVVNDAVVIANTNGLNNNRPGAILD